ncbi:MAG: IgA Peptidase M64 [Planctomycetes bacterium]|nr:IgA Peptidase M64 [Planctomycetota bacterium]
MRTTRALPAVLALLAPLPAAYALPAQDRAGATGFDALFTGRTLRLDYHHVGTAGEEHVGVDRFRIEGEWPGSRVRLLDETNYGKYLFCVLDAATNRTIWSRGFASIYGEWETTAAAKKGWASFHESQRFPEPKGPAQLVLKKRGEDGAFREFFSTTVDPKGRFVDRSPVSPRGEVSALFENGPPARKVDLLFLAEGYAAGEREKFRRDVERLAGVLFETEPYKSRRPDFNVRALFLPAAGSGISNPRKGVWRDAPFGCSFNAFDVDRYVLTFANERLREAAAQAPYDALLILLNERKYGGGGIFNLWATIAADSQEAPYMTVHEFGHSFAGLADEYYSSQVAYEEFNPKGTEPWEANVTALLDPKRVKWGEDHEASTPLPTPWEKGAYDKVDLEYQAKRRRLLDEQASEEASEALMREVKGTTGPMLAAERYAGKVGAFEGAMYEPKGLYRPEVDCIMFTRNPSAYCRVCRKAVERVIALYAE